jgi:hypothetical protein
MPLFLLKAMRLLSPRGWAIVGIVVAVCFVALGLYLKGRGDAAAAFEAARQKDIERAKQINAVAAQKAAAEREADTAKSILQEKALRDAYAKTPDSAPDPVRVRLMCERLRNTPAARLPEFATACGPGR